MSFCSSPPAHARATERTSTPALSLPLTRPSHDTRTRTQQIDAALPADPYEQLQLAHRIATHAFSAKAAGLASEVARLRSTLAARDERA